MGASCLDIRGRRTRWLSHCKVVGMNDQQLREGLYRLTIERTELEEKITDLQAKLRRNIQKQELLVWLIRMEDQHADG